MYDRQKIITLLLIGRIGQSTWGRYWQIRQKIDAAIENCELIYPCFAKAFLAREHAFFLCHSFSGRELTNDWWKEFKMLVLSRNKNESIMVSENIEITILNVRGNQVSLGITAPRFIPVHRKEVFEAIQNEGRRHNKRSNQREKPMRRLSRRFDRAKALCVDTFCCPKKQL